MDDLIELSELRIGNILSYKGKYVHVTSLDMDVDDESTHLIGFCKLGETHHEHSDWNRALFNDLKRVPLTSEILESAGFNGVEQNDGRISFFKLPKMWIEQPEYGQFKLNGGALYSGFTIQYVHQLQNLYFALTGEGLEISLTR